jgi:hypothetical protein
MDSGSVFYRKYTRFSEDSFGRMLIDKNGTKWMATNRDGVVVLMKVIISKNDDRYGYWKFTGFRC